MTLVHVYETVPKQHPSGLKIEKCCQLLGTLRPNPPTRGFALHPPGGYAPWPHYSPRSAWALPSSYSYFDRLLLHISPYRGLSSLCSLSHSYTLHLASTNEELAIPPFTISLWSLFISVLCILISCFIVSISVILSINICLLCLWHSCCHQEILNCQMIKLSNFKLSVINYNKCRESTWWQILVAGNN